MTSLKLFIFRIFIFLPCLALPAFAQAFDLLKSTPVGSWQLREEIFTEDNEQKATLFRTSMISKEQREGVTYYWIEMEMESYKIKGDKRKRNGETMVIKALVSEEVLQQKSENVMANLRGLGKEIIVQTGNQDPMLISEGGALAEAMLQGMGAQFEIDYKDIGQKTVSVPAGSFECNAMQGHSVSEMKVLFKSMRVESDTEVCFSDSVPFGTVSSHSELKNNGKPATSEAKLLQYGKSGALSKITKTPVAGPNIPNIFR